MAGGVFWEDIDVEPCRPRAGETAGWVYFLACTETKRCKIGYTRGDVESRIRCLQTGASGILRLIAKHPGTPESERNLHARFDAHRLHGEWFEMSEELFVYLSATIWLMAAVYINNGWEPELWLASGLRMIEDSGGAPLPKELGDFIA